MVKSWKMSAATALASLTAISEAEGVLRIRALLQGLPPPRRHVAPHASAAHAARGVRPLQPHPNLEEPTKRTTCEPHPSGCAGAESASRLSVGQSVSRSPDGFDAHSSQPASHPASHPAMKWCRRLLAAAVAASQRCDRSRSRSALHSMYLSSRYAYLLVLHCSI